MKASKLLKTGFGIIFLLFVLIGSCSKESEVEEIKQENVDQDIQDNQDEANTGSEADSEAPSIQILTPNGTGVFNTIDPLFTLAGIANDNKAITKIEGKLNDQISYNASGTSEWEIAGINLEEGDNSIVVLAYDEANNVASDTIIVTRNQSLTFLGIPELNPTSVTENSSAEILVSVQIASNSALIQQSVELIRVDDLGNEMESYGFLFDNGNLENGDEIKGDNVFSSYFEIVIVSELRLRVKARANQEIEEVTDYSSVFVLNSYPSIGTEFLSKASSIHQKAAQQFNEISQNNDFKTTLDLVKDGLESEPDVSEVVISGKNISISYMNGITSNISISFQDDIGNITRGGFQKSRVLNYLESRKPKIPINKQTIGINKLNTPMSSKSSDAEDIIQDRDVLIWEPFAWYLGSKEGDQISDIVQSSDYGFNLDRMQNEDCTIKSLFDLNEYGLVLLSTHGSAGKWIYTSETVKQLENGQASLSKAYLDVLNDSGMLTANAIWIWEYGKPLKFTENYIAINDQFIRHIGGNFPNSIIINSSCESSLNPNLSYAFLSKGAKAYLGWDNIVNTRFCEETTPKFVENLISKNLNAGEAYESISSKTDNTIVGILASFVTPSSWLDPANFTFVGSNSLYFSNSFNNGNFELNSLAGWNNFGDGRIITQLGPLSPWEGSFMSIISTGLGFTTSSGGISQTFQVDNQDTYLSINWNFISEEFLEYVGSIYQDYLKITITSDGISEIVFEKNIDQFAGDYELIVVSPDIVFDIGDVYMTNWQETIIDLIPYRNKNITITIEVGDVGDSVYDSAVLLDDIRIE